MGLRVPSYRIWRICVALYYGWTVEWINNIPHQNVLGGTPYPPSLAKIGRPRLLTALHEKVRDN